MNIVMAKATFKKTTLFATAFVLAVSTLTAAVPFILGEEASAVSGAAYSSVGLSGWVTDRTAPSGGVSQTTFDGRDVLALGVVTPTGASSTFYQYEGVKKSINATKTIKADLYVDSSWPTNTRAGIWGEGYDSANAISSYPIIEFNKSSSTGWRIFNSAGAAGWREVAVPSATAGWNTIELAINKTDSTITDVYVNSAFVGTSTGDPTESLKTIFLNNYNSGSGDYTVRWSNIQAGQYIPDVPTSLRFTKDGTSTVVADGSTVDYSNVTLRWDAVRNAERYQVRVTNPSGDSQAKRHTGSNNFALNDAVRHGLFATEQGPWSYEVQTKDKTTQLWSGYSAPVKLSYDIVNPVISNVSIVNGAMLNGSGKLTITVTDNINLKHVVANFKTSNNVMVRGGNNIKPVTGIKGTVEVSLPVGLSQDTDYKVSIGVVDQAGNAASTVHRTFRIDNTAPAAVTNLAWKTSGGDVLGSGDATHLMGGVALWDASASIDVSNYNYKYWNNIPTSDFKVGSEYPVNSVSGLSLPGVFNQGVGTHYFSVVAVDRAGNKSEPTVFRVSYDTAFAVAINDVAGDSATPTVSGVARWSADNQPVVNENLKVIVDDTTYPVQTNTLGAWAVTVPAANALADGSYTVSVADASNNPVGTKTFKIELPKFEEIVTVAPVTPVTPAAPGVPTTPIPLAIVIPAAVPAIVNPATFAEVLGETTDNTSANNAAETKGASTENRGILAVAADSEANKGTFLSLGWYWWLLIIAAVAGTAWWIFGAIRNRQAES